MAHIRQRVKQFFAALTAKVTPADNAFVATHLDAAGQKLFYAMNLPDQRHALNVAYTARGLAAGRTGVDLELLTRAALLHDVGKEKGDVSTFDKTAAVVAHSLAPRWSAGWGRPGRGGKVANLRHAFHIYFHHPERGAAMLAAIGADPRIVAVVERHHRAPTPDEPPELAVLREADGLH